MRNRIAALRLSAVVRPVAAGIALSWAALGANLLGSGAVARAAESSPPAAPRPAINAASVPIREVVLFSSGVGYFEHYGTVTGDGETELPFKAQQINDILKSLVLQDLDKGRITSVTYPSQGPLSQAMRSFQVDITANPALHDLLEQLRGARVKVTLNGQPLEGTILGVEKKQHAVGEGGTAQLIDAWSLNLLAGDDKGGIPYLRGISLDEVRDVQVEDPKLRDELAAALAALAAARDQGKKPVSIHFAGVGPRRVRIGYVVETPVWKTSYRLLLDDAAANAPETKPAAGAAQAAAAPHAAGTGGKLQGWAIVENQTDNDWNNVQLSLVSGRPISFIQDLYTPLFIPRPLVSPELYASLRPQTYEGGLSRAREYNAFEAAAAAPGSDEQANGRSAGRQMKAMQQLQNQVRGGRVRDEEKQLGALYDASAKGSDRAKLSLMDAAESVASVASAAKVGELFQYTVGSVSLSRQNSAMIPVVADAVEAEKVSIYNAAVLPKNPLLGARLKNTTGKHLLQGPVTVLEAGGYAGDARIDDVPPGQERLISYGVDQQVRVIATAGKQVASVQTGKIVKGVLTLTHKLVASEDYAAENKGDKGKTLIIEHPRRAGWTLVDPAKADETTETLYRFKGQVAAAKATKLTVREERITAQEIALLPSATASFDRYIRSGEIPQPVRDALVKAAALKSEVFATQRQIQQREKSITDVTQEQARIRENMKTVAHGTEYATRLLKKLDEQETAIEKLQGEIAELKTTLDRQRKAMEDYLVNLNVEGK